MKRLIAGFLCALALFALAGCGKAEPARDKYEEVFYGAFDSAITVTAYCGSEERFQELFALVESEFLRYHKLFDIYFSYIGVNNIKSLNDSAGIAPVAVDGEVIELIDFGREMYELTEGRVNIAFGAVLRIWHDARDYNNMPSAEKKLPDMAALKTAAEHCHINDIIIDRDAGTVYLSDGEMSLDVGSVAKGFATERIARLLEAQGCEGVTINAGGNVRTVGLKPGGGKWNIAVTNPDTSSPEAYVDLVEVGSAAVVTSGVYQRFFEYEGRRYHHIIDGVSLMPEQRYLSVTVVAADSAYADALSTAVFNMDFREGLDFVESLDGTEALWVLADGGIHASSGFHK